MKQKEQVLQLAQILDVDLDELLTFGVSYIVYE
jgi:hypothetical protein